MCILVQRSVDWVIVLKNESTQQLGNREANWNAALRPPPRELLRAWCSFFPFGSWNVVQKEFSGPLKWCDSKTVRREMDSVRTHRGVPPFSLIHRLGNSNGISIDKTAWSCRHAHPKAHDTFGHAAVAYSFSTPGFRACRGVVVAAQHCVSAVRRLGVCWLNYPCDRWPRRGYRGCRWGWQHTMIAARTAAVISQCDHRSGTQVYCPIVYLYL